MGGINAFVGHNFSQQDESDVREFLAYFDNIKESDIGFDWTHAENAEVKELAKKVREKMEGKNLFI